MRIALVQNSIYFPTFGGANKANRVVLESLARQGHDCYVVSPSNGSIGPCSSGEYEIELARRHITTQKLGTGGIQFDLNGVTVWAVEIGQLKSQALALLGSLKPDWILVPSEDSFQLLLKSVLEAGIARVGYFAHTTMLLPFGPGSFFPSARGASLLSRVDLIITISDFLWEYIHTWGNINAARIHPSLYGPGPFVNRGCFSSGDVLMVNPCALKGISIFLGLADALPSVSFAAVPTWGTSPSEMAELQSRPNIKIVQPVDDIDELLRNARVLLVPSLWTEAFGMIVVEAMLRGIPVLASNVGGLPEAKLGVDYVLPVNPITEYTRKLDTRLIPEAVVPRQEMSVWKDVLKRVLTDKGHYEDLSRRSFEAANRHVSGLSIESLERALNSAAGKAVDTAAL